MKGGKEKEVKMKTKKLLVFLVIFSVMLGMIGVAIGVPQGIEVTISPDIHVVIAPTTVNFGAVIPGDGNNAVEDVSFNATGSNVDVNVEVTIVTGDPFKDGLNFGGTLAEGQDIVLPCVHSGELCTYVLETVETTLDIPIAFQKGLKSGTITYTITEVTP